MRSAPSAWCSCSREIGCSRAFRASRQAVPGRDSGCGGRRCAPTALRCSVRGRAAELASFASLTALRQLRRVSLRSALRAPTPALRFSSPQTEPLPGTTCRSRGVPAGGCRSGRASVGVLRSSVFGHWAGSRRRSMPASDPEETFARLVLAAPKLPVGPAHRHQFARSKPRTRGHTLAGGIQGD